MRRALGAGLVALAALGLSGCVMMPPSVNDIAGRYTADGATVELRADGSCRVIDFPSEFTVGEDGQPVLGEPRFDATCAPWSLGGQFASGAWDIQVDAAFQIAWLQQIGRDGCLIVYIGDTDSNDYWELCEPPAG